MLWSSSSQPWDSFYFPDGLKVTNLSLDNKTLNLQKGDAFAQGVFLKYYTTVDDVVTASRVGGMGSTDKVSK